MPQRMQELKARGAVVFDAERVRPDGSRLFMSVGAKVVSGEGRGVIQSIVRDLTERRHIEERLRQAQKMEAVGRLAGGIAHDFRNQLTVIHGYAELLRDRPGISEDEAENVREILKASARSSEMTGQLLAFSRNDLLQFKVTDLAALVADIGKSLPRLVGEDVRVSVAAGDETCCANLDPNQFQQAIFNLAVNARHAMPGGGQLSIEVARVDLDEEFAQRQPDTRPGPYVRVSVADTGCGMDAATLERAFEPFFTTKEVGAGTGLGLSMVYGFVKQSGGSVEVDSEPGKGSTFRLYFPRLEACTEGARAQAPKAESPKGRETILVVEDEDLVRRLLVTFLREAGYTALDVADPGSAAPLVKAYHGPIHLMVTDVVMPEINGVELARRIRELRPGIPLLFITGYASRDLSPCGLDEMDGELLAKPFGRDELLQKIRQVLDAQTGAE
jgi:signal transduction histidine kinase/ActR/RegA family two-component response regulator